MSASGLGRLSRSATKIVAKAANGFHLLRVDGYSQTKRLLPGQMLSSQGFNVGGHLWRIDYYPNGRATSPKPNSDAISVYLQTTDRVGVKSLQQARYKFSLVDHAGNAAYELPAETGSFTSFPIVYPHHDNTATTEEEERGPGCGHEEFIGKEELEKRREDLIRDDRMVIRCDVGVPQIEVSPLAQDELIISDGEEEDDQEYDAPGHGYGGHSRRRGRQRRRIDDNDYVKWCLTQKPGGSRGRRH